MAASLQHFISLCSLPSRTLRLSSPPANSSSFRTHIQQQLAPEGNKLQRKWLLKGSTIVVSASRETEGARQLAQQHQVHRQMEVQNACNCCGRRNLLTSVGGALLSGVSDQGSQAADVDYVNAKEIMDKVHPRRPAWYQELYAQVLNVGMRSYEAEMAGYKQQLFDYLDENVRSIVEVGIGTGPNLKFYGGRPHIEKVIGVDPNEHMARFAEQAASAVGLAPSQFEFLPGVAEGLPVADASMDAAVCTLVMCSVSDVSATLKEVQRILKPGGMFLFIEHVGAPDVRWQRKAEEISGTQPWIEVNNEVVRCGRSVLRLLRILQSQLKRLCPSRCMTIFRRTACIVSLCCHTMTHIEGLKR